MISLNSKINDESRLLIVATVLSLRYSCSSIITEPTDEDKMNKIDNVITEEMGQSAFVKPFRMRYVQNGKKKIWDCIQAHDSVAILIHHIERDTFVVVRQFRPAVYISNAREANNGVTPKEVNTETIPTTDAITYELCAGIMDKDGASVMEVARQEVLEECGYDVPSENIEVITQTRSGVGIMGTTQTLFYARVTAAMQKTKGGGNAEEGEFIDVEEIPVKDSFEFALDNTKVKPIGMSFAILWFHSVKAKQLGSV